MNYQQKTAIVTGAVKGIGKAVSLRLMEDGFKVLGIDLDVSSGKAMEAEFPDFSFHQLDISKAKDVNAFWEHLTHENISVYALVNNAGIIRDNMIWNMSEEEFDTVIQINLKGTWLMCRAAAIHMKPKANGRMVNIASRAWLGNRGQSNYAASKAGVVACTRVLALELGKYGILVNAIAPGLIDTPLTQQLSPEVRASLIAAQPGKNIGKPEDVAHAVSFLVNPQTQFITGQVVYVDGGKSLGSNLSV